MKPEFSQQSFEKKTQVSSFIKIRSVGAELFRAEIQTYSRLSQSCERA